MKLGKVVLKLRCDMCTPVRRTPDILYHKTSRKNCDERIKIGKGFKWYVVTESPSLDILSDIHKLSLSNPTSHHRHGNAIVLGYMDNARRSQMIITVQKKRGINRLRKLVLFVINCYVDISSKTEMYKSNKGQLLLRIVLSIFKESKFVFGIYRHYKSWLYNLPTKCHQNHGKFSRID